MKRLTNESGVLDVEAKETLGSRMIRRFQSNLVRGGPFNDFFNWKKGTGHPYRQALKEGLIGAVVLFALLMIVSVITSWGNWGHW
jgi:hypothetical protein